MPKLRTLLAIGVVALVAVAGASGQSGPQAVDPTIAELRALKADLNERLEANIRVQLLVARLQLQEQRTNTVVRQLAEVQEKLRTHEQTKTQAEAGMKMFGLDATKTEEEAEGFAILFGPLKAQLELMAKAEADLKVQQTELTTALGQEQARWAAFNAKLEELERLFEKKK